MSRIFMKYISLPCRILDYCINTDYEGLINVIIKIYGQYVLDIPSRNIVIINIFTVDQFLFRIVIEGVQQFVTDPIQAIFNYLFANPYFENEILALHGAAIEYNTKAIAFLASTYGGKTTLATYLVERGCGFITEDCTLVDNSNKVKPIQIPIHLREGGIQVLKGQNINIRYEYVDYFSFKRYLYMPVNIVKKSTKLNRIIFIKRNDDINSVRLLSKKEAFFKLVKSTMKLYSLKEPSLSMFKRLLEVPCFEVNYRHPQYIYDFIKS